MPLYTSCPCRANNTPYMAQMMRVYIVTPPLTKNNFESTIHFLLQPRVQPNPSPCPIFRPSYEGPIKLNENNIWVLRLPYPFLFNK